MSIDDMSEEMWQLLFGIRRSARYHDKCVQRFETMHRITAGASLLLSSAAAASLLQSVDSKFAIWAAGIVAALSAIDLVVGFSAKARLHADLKRRHIALESAIISTPGDDCLSAHTTARLAIEADEPPVWKRLDIACHKELMAAMGLKTDPATAR